MRVRSTIGTFLKIAIACVLLGGCASPDIRRPSEKEQESPAPRTVARTAPLEAAPPEPSAEPAIAPRPREKPIGFAFDPNRLINLTEPEIVALAGAPENVRDEPPATVWRYSAGDCLLDLYFYHSVKTETLRSLTFNLLTTSNVRDAKAYCLSRSN